jgi:hypothetical protein
VTAAELLADYRRTHDVEPLRVHFALALVESATDDEDDSDRHQPLRDELTPLLMRDRQPADYALVRALFAVEGERARAIGDGGGEAMQALGYLLWRYGRKEDVFLMLDTMYISMDTHACLDAMMITLQTPLQEMLAYFEAETSTWAPSKRDRLRTRLQSEYRDARSWTAEGYIDTMESYFRSWIAPA